MQSLHVAIQERDRDINKLAGRLAEARDQLASIHGVETVYHRHLMEATMALCTGGDHHALPIARRTI